MSKSDLIADHPAGTAKKWSVDSTDAPRTALQFRYAFKFAAADAKKDGATVPFTMTARTGEVVESWYWGRCVHDMSGMQLSKPILPVDWCHDANVIMGFADKFDASTGNLIVSGALTPMPDDDSDRAAEVIYKQNLGVPYEASIDFSGDSPVIEYVPQGATVAVNGQKFEGPGVVFRQWTLRSVAICPYGADSDTCIEFSGEASKVSFTQVNKLNKGNPMPETNTPAVAAAAAASTATPATTPAVPTKLSETPATPAGEVKPQTKFITAFGDQGARWFLDGKPFEDCATEFVAQLKTTHATELTGKQTQFDKDKAALQTQLDAANAKLAAIPRGDKGVAFSAEGEAADPKLAKASQGLAPGTSRFAAGIKLPTSTIETKK